MINYQVQASSLQSDSDPTPLGRYLVEVGNPVTFETTLDIEAIANVLKDGNAVAITNATGEILFSIQPTLTGSFPLSEPATPTASNIGIGFRPSKQLLALTRFEPGFLRVATTVRQPAIVSVTSSYLNEPYASSIIINGGHSSFVTIRGTDLKLNPDDPLTINYEFTSDGTPESVVAATNFITHTASTIQFTTKPIATPPLSSTGSLVYTAGDRTVSYSVAVVDMT